MSTLKETLFKKIEEHRPRITRLLKEHGDVKVSEVTIAQAIGGARGVKCLVTDVSYLDPYEGIRFRGKTIPETFAALPTEEGNEYPSVEGFFYYLMTGEVPTAEQAGEVIEDFKKRQQPLLYGHNVADNRPPLGRMDKVKKEKISAADKAAILGRITPTTEVGEMAAADYLVEAATENEPIKNQIFKTLDEVCKPQVILSSNTSAILTPEKPTRNAKPY